MEMTIKRKAFLEELPKIVEDVVREYGPKLKKIEIIEDEKGCYTVFITYESNFRPAQ
ncbi:hypothetical protein TON_1892 [Thermococcus onnurineus NA1]|uniref:Uncharacterized protein n=1 Tax=Thermococcus onnurineus (strain NA1) TaxID=523850 RepID=B6YVQ9_THEON|nr:hypothetical protein [Thermococcus onnurineus]ACJ17383.1 hypothetical protein TON_1892 [Thermococcus onnurineus NA1]